MFKGGMPGNMNNLIKQAQKMQKQLEESKAEVESKIFEATVGGGAVTAKVNGKKEVVDIIIKEEVVDPDDVEMLQDLIISAVNKAISDADKEMGSTMGKLTGGMNMPGLF
ncbi:YbaB/EbfC family nucleoid-associated protein [Clostridium cylindrosporum]|uniref:Nucleoid-associated protein CLCY_10c00190 n=1 Tax=Clostridium cylindrosporum DSM 605 TaxID=1121307 RepID=A0A0J8DE25_CLOCY|nr:YbaB/EbfC family nucleoid-associated protein [Clostridium cylindrosporum]KMT22474.1 DNA-binding protein, YbaB/EbfC family [Clostridium cylindrosporum DSM 605]